MATTGMRAVMSEMIPNHDSAMTITPVAAEYPIRPPMAFHPG